MDFFNFSKQKNKLNAIDAYNLCKIASERFNFNFPISKSNIEHYGSEFKKSQDFTALLICSSIIYINSERKKDDNVKFNPYEIPNGLIYNYIPFYIELIKLILNEAKEIKTEMMQSCLGGGFDGEDYHVEDTQEFLCMMYIYNVSRVLLNYKYKNINTLTQLAYNYFEVPGILNYHSQDYHIIEDLSKLTTFSHALDESLQIIIQELKIKEIDHYLM